VPITTVTSDVHDLLLQQLGQVPASTSASAIGATVVTPTFFLCPLTHVSAVTVSRSAEWDKPQRQVFDRVSMPLWAHLPPASFLMCMQHAHVNAVMLALPAGAHEGPCACS
jgi:hypothetical protein